MEESRIQRPLVSRAFTDQLAGSWSTVTSEEVKQYSLRYRYEGVLKLTVSVAFWHSNTPRHSE